jgi:hypothetical protein
MNKIHALLKPSFIALAMAAAFPAAAQTAPSPADLAKELEALKARIAELEKALGAVQAAPKPQWGMTPEQAAEFNRIAVKTESLEDQRDALGFKGLKISGVIDPTFIYNRNQNRAGAQFLTNSADDGYFYDNSYMGMALIDFQKETDNGTKWRLTLAPNRGAGSFANGGSIVHEASVSLPLDGDKLRLLAGQIPDWSGYEFLPANQNKLITHNLLFDLTLPTIYTGAGLEGKNGDWVFKSIVGNMNAAKRQSSDRRPMLAARVDYARGEFSGLGGAAVVGWATNFNDPNLASSRVSLWEVDGYFVRGDLTVMGQVSFGTQEKAAITPDPNSGEFRNSRWWGVSGLMGYKLQPRLEAIARADFINNKKHGGGLLGYTLADDRNGLGPDPLGDPEVGANRFALSLGLNYLFNENTQLKVEYRLDRASQPVFINVKDGLYLKTNQLFGTAVVVTF